MIRAIRNRLKKYGLLECVERVCKARHVPLEEVLGDTQRPFIAHVRHEVWATMHVMGLRYCEIARLFGRHHTTVLTGVRRHGARTGVPSGTLEFAS